MAAAAAGPISEKPKDERLKEALEIFRSLKSLGIPFDAPEVQELKARVDAYVQEGVCWTGTVSFARFGRIAEVNLPRRADRQIEVTLRKPRVGCA
jgi:hypothetical protein